MVAADINCVPGDLSEIINHNAAAFMVRAY
jgi:hypothetical protein